MALTISASSSGSRAGVGGSDSFEEPKVGRASSKGGTARWGKRTKLEIGGGGSEGSKLQAWRQRCLGRDHLSAPWGGKLQFQPPL